MSKPEEVTILEKELRDEFRKIWEIIAHIGFIYKQIDNYNGKTKTEFTPEQRLNQGRVKCPSCG